jgi:DNA-directed RNA polymerase subunit N (RpoN/RPB10)
MDQVPTLCLSCGGNVGFILQFRELMAKRIAKRTKKFDMNQFDLTNIEVRNIIESFGLDPSIDNCCVTMIMSTRLASDIGIVAYT